MALKPGKMYDWNLCPQVKRCCFFRRTARQWRFSYAWFLCPVHL